MISVDELARICDLYGTADSGYLRSHWLRFSNTKTILEQGRSGGGKRFLDIGAHWLHQSMLYSLDGYAVTAADLPDTMESPSVVNLAKAYNIRLISCRNLAAPTEFSHLPDGSFDIILFAEILEHITFNPMRMWTELYRLLSEGGRIVVTTPNYYAASRRLMADFRVLAGRGAGIGVEEILGSPTYGHHWKEYSRHEVERYFKLLSPDFHIHRSFYVHDALPWPQSKAILFRQAVQKAIPPLRSRLHVEIDLPKKLMGVTINPEWG